MQRSNPLSQGSSRFHLYGNCDLRVNLYPNNLPLNLGRNISLTEPANNGNLGGISIVVLGPTVDPRILGPAVGDDVVMGASEEERPLGIVETTNRPCFQTKDLGVSLVKDSTSANFPTSVNLEHGVNRSQ
ncbi:hypothetical protein V6N12_010892 [Hibiscus sabdariffa]|uniref:Uncharacterized protein n=1 Tax=Hibiscus sabdariffa TaxID=183260 RepID=A0ABR2ELF1_9ROSI